MSTASLPKTMRAVLQPDKTSHDLIMDESHPIPTLSHPDDVLIKVAATCPCLGELDWAADMPNYFTEPKDPIPGQDVAGTVVAVGSDNRQFAPGQAVYGRLTANRPGGCAEYTTARTEELALRPAGLGWDEAAATPLSALTAWQALFYEGPLKKEAVLLPDDASNQEREAARQFNAGKKVFIAGAGTSVGTWAVQFAALAGVKSIVTVCSGSRAAQMKNLGVTEIVDYTQTSVEAWAAAAAEAKDVEADLVLDCIGGAAAGQLWSVARDGGLFLSICGDPNGWTRPEGGNNADKKMAKAEWFIVTSIGWQLAELSPVLESRRAGPVIDSVLPFDKFAEAFDKVEGRRAKGKVVIQVSE